MIKNLTVDAAATRLSFHIFAAHGVSVKTLEHSLGVTKAQLDEPDRRIPFISHHQMIKKGVELTEPGIGLKIGAQSTLERMGIVGHIIKNCNDLEDAGLQLIRYFKLFFGLIDWKLIKTKTTASFIYSLKNQSYYMQFGAEVMLSSAITIMRSLTSSSFTPKEIHFRYEVPEYVLNYHEVFRAPLKFNQNQDAILMTKDQLKQPISNGQSYIKAILQKHADSLLANIHKSHSLKSQVQQLILTELPTGMVDIDLISKKLQMSRWTLTRKLKEEGTTFKQLLKGSREKLAQSYLKRQTESVTEIAFLLGYSEPSAFQRAFKSWTGKTPFEYRQVHSAE